MIRIFTAQWGKRTKTGMTGNGYHLPVMVREIMGYFAVSAEGVFVEEDGTFVVTTPPDGDGFELEINF